MGDSVLYEVGDSVATVTFNRPEKLNPMNVELLEDTLVALQRAADDDGVGAVIVTGAGRGFSAGGDRDEGAEAWGGSLAGDIAKLRELSRSTEVLVDMDKPTIAAINGPCAGGALSLACGADLRYAAESAVFTTAFVSAGLTGDFGGTQTLARVVGPAKARELYMLGARIDAGEALRLGLVSEVLPDDSLMAHVRDIASRLAALPIGVIAGIKRNLNDALVLSLPELLDREAERQVKAARAVIERATP